MGCDCSAACWWRGKITFWNIVVILLFGVYGICDYEYYTNTLDSGPFKYCQNVSTSLFQWFVILGLTAYTTLIYVALLFYGVKESSKKVIFVIFMFILSMMGWMISFGSICILNTSDDNYSASFYCGPSGKFGGYLLIVLAFVLGICAASIAYFTINLFISYNERQAHALLTNNDENDVIINANPDDNNECEDLSGEIIQP